MSFLDYVFMVCLQFGSTVALNTFVGVQDFELDISTGDDLRVSMDNLGSDISKYTHVITNEMLNSYLRKNYNTTLKDIILDPGFGFGKTLEQNYQLMNELEKLSVMDLPLLVGISRKSMIYKLLGFTAEESLNGTTALNTIALMKGASILRVHDVREAVECVKIVKSINS